MCEKSKIKFPILLRYETYISNANRIVFHDTEWKILNIFIFFQSAFFFFFYSITEK